MSFAMIKRKADALFNEASFISRIRTKNDYQQALSLMDDLIEDYDNNKLLIEVLSVSIERWENKANEFQAFNKQLKSLNSGVAVLKVLMEQHGLGVSDLPEIGSKSLVSKILNNKRQLTLAHIQALSKRFNIDPRLFI
ncbi:MAG: transcriptional regulator [Coxiellaceae bacterium]|nr:transcriptional regulator [Coxiellaceae bacterium]